MEQKISIQDARAIMGEDAEGLSDNDIQVLIDNLSALARTFVDMVLKFE